MLYYGTLWKIHCKESTYSMLEANLQNCPLTNLNKNVNNVKSEIFHFCTLLHTHTPHTKFLCERARCWNTLLLTKNKRTALTSISMPFQNKQWFGRIWGKGTNTTVVTSCQYKTQRLSIVRRQHAYTYHKIWMSNESLCLAISRVHSVDTNTHY